MLLSIACYGVIHVRLFQNKRCIKWIIISELTGAVSGILSIGGMRLFNETQQNAPLTPPGWIFPVVWSILYALMGIGACIVDEKRKENAGEHCLNLFVAQLIVNFFWPLIFFNAQAFLGALIWLVLLWILVLIMIVCYSKISKTAAWLQVPYLVWLSFAIYLNLAVLLINI